MPAGPHARCWHAPFWPAGVARLEPFALRRSWRGGGAAVTAPRRVAVAPPGFVSSTALFDREGAVGRPRGSAGGGGSAHLPRARAAILPVPPVLSSLAVGRGGLRAALALLQSTPSPPAGVRAPGDDATPSVDWLLSPAACLGGRGGGPGGGGGGVGGSGGGGRACGGRGRGLWGVGGGGGGFPRGPGGVALGVAVVRVRAAPAGRARGSGGGVATQHAATSAASSCGSAGLGS